MAFAHRAPRSPACAPPTRSMRRDGTEAAQALREAGAAHVYLAGKPGDLEAALRKAGIESFVAAGGNALETLTGAYDHLGA